MTTWTKLDKTATTWSGISKTATSYDSRHLVNLGATMADEDYTMADTTLTMGDYKLNSVYSKPTTWTT